MWFLEHETLFGGKRVWLRPGSQQLFGRTKRSDGDSSAGKNVFIDNKNVSRKHMTIKVLDAPLVDGTKVHKRTRIEIADLSCRQGTVVDGDKTLKSSKETDGSIVEDKIMLTGTEHTIRLSHSYPPFTVKWQDVVFTYASKEKKGPSQSQASTRNTELHAIDIKTSSEFLPGKTTHVVSQKRNLPKVLQALVSGIPVITVDYLDAILSAAANTTNSEGNYVPSQLEEDFDAWWPKEKEYVPPAGQEPVPRPDQMLAPDPARSEVFSGLTFIFLNEAQHSNLHQVVAGGGGKALLFDIRLGETTVDEYVDYVRSVAGKKKRGGVGKQSLPVVTIRLSTYPIELEEWATNFVTAVDRALNQRSVLQNEFLDAIITKDASTLCRSPTETETSSSVPEVEQTQPSLRESTPTVQYQTSLQGPDPTESVPPSVPSKTTTRKRPARRAVTSRFTGFDDYEPPTKIRKVESTQEQDTPMERNQASEQQSVPEYESQAHSQMPSATQTQHATQARPQTIVDASIQMDRMFPASAQLRKKREATQALVTAVSVQPDTRAEADPGKAQTRLERIKTKQAARDAKLKQDINIKEETRKRMAEDEDRRREEEEQLRAALEGVDISKMHVDIQIEDMKLRPREDRTVARPQPHGEGWKPEWTGRKNFKNFRRRGTDQGARAQSQKIIVTLKPAPPRKGFGDSMVMDEIAPVRTAEDEKRLKRRLGGRLPDSDDERPIGFQKRKRTKPTEVIDVEDSGPDEEELPRGTGSTIRNSGRTQRVVETQLEDTQTQRGSKKRAAGPLTVAAGQPSVKKSRNFARDEDSDEEEGGFRFTKRTRARV